MTTITKLEQTCAACPSQWEGKTSDGDYVYIRYRWGYLSVTLYAIDKLLVHGKQIFGKAIGEDLDGAMSFEELKEATKEKIEFRL